MVHVAIYHPVTQPGLSCLSIIKSRTLWLYLIEKWNKCEKIIVSTRYICPSSPLPICSSSLGTTTWIIFKHFPLKSWQTWRFAIYFFRRGIVIIFWKAKPLCVREESSASSMVHTAQHRSTISLHSIDVLYSSFMWLAHAVITPFGHRVMGTFFTLSKIKRTQFKMVYRVQLFFSFWSVLKFTGASRKSNNVSLWTY